MNEDLKDWLRQSLFGRIAARAKAYWAAPPPPDPWTAEADEAVRSDEALPLCPRCLTPQEGTDWFCPKCGASVGPYNNLMPYVNTFSLGEVARAGVGNEVRRTWFTVVGYFLFAIGANLVLSPFYLIRLILRWKKTASDVSEEQ